MRCDDVHAVLPPQLDTSTDPQVGFRPPGSLDALLHPTVAEASFRSVYATVIQRWLGRDPSDIIGGAYPMLGFV
jgi:hypothetical protein